MDRYKWYVFYGVFRPVAMAYWKMTFKGACNFASRCHDAGYMSVHITTDARYVPKI